MLILENPKTAGCARVRTTMNVSDVTASSASSSATVHGVVVGELSPIKTSTKNSAVKYFDGRFGDGKRTVRLVSFDATLRKKLEDVRKSGGGVALQNCMVKRKAPDDFELHVNNKSTVLSSPKKFKVTEEVVRNDVPDCAQLGTLEEIKDVAEHQLVCITGKVTALSKIEELVKKSSGKVFRKRDFVIADPTASCRGVVWEQHLDVLKEETSYKISNATIRSFNGAKYLSLGERVVINTVDDIGNIVDESVFNETGGVEVVEGEIIAVLKTEVYVGCRNCSSKVLEVEGIGECTKCGAKMKVGKCKCKHIARVVLEDVNDKEYRVTMFDQVIQQVVRFSNELSSGGIDDQLLTSPSLIYTIKDEIITSVSRIVTDQEN